MTYPREALNRIRWAKGGLEGAMVTYVHRGAPGDVKSVRGDDITGLERSFFTVGRGKIPYHRVIRIEMDGEVVYLARPNAGARCSSGSCA